MALRYVESLEHEDWVALVKEFKKGPSTKHREVVRKAIEETKHLGMPEFDPD